MQPEPLDWPAAQNLELFYRCANCYGFLKAKFAPKRKYIVVCDNCGDDCRGYVTEDYVDRMRSNSKADYNDAKWLLTRAGVWPDKTTDQLSKEVNQTLGGE